ncbi:6877_t:CDS:1, partial [Funneliformis caledonium]
SRFKDNKRSILSSEVSSKNGSISGLKSSSKSSSADLEDSIKQGGKEFVLKDSE